MKFSPKTFNKAKVFEKNFGMNFLKKVFPKLIFFALLPLFFFLSVVSLKAADFSSPVGDSFYEGFSSVPGFLKAELERIYYRIETINGLFVIVPSPTKQIQSELERLERKYPKEPAIPLLFARVKVELGEFNGAKLEMEKYVRLSNRSSHSLVIYADFLHSRLLFEEEVRVLEEAGDILARGDDKDKRSAKKIYSRIINLINSTNLKKFDPIAYQRKILDIYPNDAETAREYVRELEALGKAEEALKEAEKFESRFSVDRRGWVKLRADILNRLGRIDEAIRLYDSLRAGDDEGLFEDYFSLLEETGKLTSLVKTLGISVWAPEPTDSSTMARWFWYKRLSGEFEDAEKGLKEWIKKLESTGKLKENLSAIGELLLNTENLSASSPYFYTLYVTATDYKIKEYALWGLFRTLVNNDFHQGVFSWGYAPGKDLLELDNLPSIGGGVLSLLLNGQGLQSKSKELENVSIGYHNSHMSAIVVDEMRKIFPLSEYLPRMESILIERAVLVQNWEAVEYFAKAFITNYANDARKYDVMFALALSYRNRNMFSAEEDTYARIMKDAYNTRDDELYSRAFYENIVSLTIQERYSDVLKFYWNEIKLHPENETLYNELLNFAEEHELFNEELKAYQQAIKQFNKSDWYNKLARWYLKRQGKEAFQRVVVKIRDELDEPLLNNFFAEFLELDWYDLNSADNRFYLECYLYANKKFPHNLNFVRRLKNFYEANLGIETYKKELELLSLRYFIFDEDIRRGLFRYWSKNGTLSNFIESLQSKADRNIAENFLLAYALGWVGDYEGELAHLQGMADLYPGSQTVWEQISQLERSLAYSFGIRDVEVLESSAERYLHLAKLYPLNTNYTISAGEVFAERGDMVSAKKTWWTIVDAGPASLTIYKELATVFWDYYQFDDAILAFKKIREIQKSPLLFAMELGNIYEWKGDYGKAIEEYIKYHCEHRGAANDILARLAFLSNRKKMGQTIEKTYQSEIANRPLNYDSLLAYVDYLFEVGKKSEALSVLESGLKRYPDVDFLRNCATIFAEQGRRDLQEKALLRIVEERGGEYDAYMELAAFYESRKAWEKAEKIYLTLIELSQDADEEYQSRALSNIASFYWRRGEFEKGLKYYLLAADKLKYEKREALLYETARKCINQGLLDDATGILSELIRTNPQESSYFNLLAQVYAIKGDVESLVTLYREALDNLRKVDIPQHARKEKLIILREGLAQNYTLLKRYNDALDQYIEMINLDPLDKNRLQEVYDFAVRYNLLNKLISYYKELSERAYKNYRWQVVLARIYTWQNERDLAQEAFRKAIKLEPQIDWLHQELADLYLTDGMFDDLVATYEYLARLTPSSPIWNIRIASALFRAGRRELAIEKAKASIAINPPSFVPYLELADFFVTWDVSNEAKKTLEMTLDKFREGFCNEALGVYEANKLVRVAVFSEGFEGAFKKLRDLKSFVSTNFYKNNCIRGELLNQSLDSIKKALSIYLPRYLADYGTAADFEKMSTEILNWVKEDGSDEVYDLCLNFAVEAHLSDLERALYAWWLSTHKDDLQVGYKKEQYTKVFKEFENFFTKRRDYRGIRYLKESNPSLVDYRLVSHVQRVEGDEEGEIASLINYLNSFANQKLGGFNGENEEVRRYVQLLLKRKMDDKVKDAIKNPSSLTGYFINELIAQGRPDLAIFGISEACKEKGKLWQNAKTALILSYFGDYSERTFAIFGKLLGIAPIGESVIRRKEDVLSGKSWTQYAWYYGEFLDRAGKKEYTKWLNALAEANPRNESSYLKAGDYQLKHKRYKEALAQYELALQISPDSREAKKRYATALYQLGRKNEAIDMLMGMASDTDPASYLYVYEVLVDVGEKLKGEKILANYVERIWANPPGGLYGILNVLMESWRDNATDKENFLKKLAQITPRDIYFLQTVIEKEWLKGVALNFCYKGILEFLEGETPVNEELLSQWRLEYIQHLIESGDVNEAHSMIQKSEREGILEEDALGEAKIKLYLKMGKIQEAEIEMKKYLGEELSSWRYENIISLLEEMGYEEEVDRWREKMFMKNIAEGSESVGDYVGLADILFKRGNTKQAIEYLERLILISPENPEGLRTGAIFAERHDLFSHALKWRKKLVPFAPDDDLNKFQVVWLTAKTGELDEAVNMLISLLNAPKTTNAVRFKAGLKFPELVVSRKDLVLKLEQDTLERIKKSPRQEDFILLANLKLGDVNAQKQVLEEALLRISHPYYCAWMLADIYENIGDLNAVSEYLHKVLYYLPDDDRVLIQLSDTELRHKNPRAALDALPSVNYQYFVEPTFNSDNIERIKFALRGIQHEASKQVEFFMRLSETAEQLGWLDMAIAFAEGAMDILRVETRISVPTHQQASGEQRWRRMFSKEPTASTERKFSEVSQRIKYLKTKKTQKLKAKSSILKITSNLENLP